MIGQTVSHYYILSKLGEGGMGVVYLAEDTILRRQVALKMLTDTCLGRQHFRSRFLREAIAVSALSHPNIATIYDYGETKEGYPFIVMELVKGPTLADLINDRALTPERAVEIIIDVAHALGEAHRNQIVHRDIKPSNIAINGNGQVKVLDFGLAKQLEFVDEAKTVNPTPVVNTQTREGVILGTPMYASPEQAMGAPVDARSDLFSLGSVFYECIAGQAPFTGVSPMEICTKVIRDDPPPPSSLNPGVSAELDRIALKSLAKKPDERYQSAELCIKDLLAAEQSLKGNTPLPEPPRPPAEPVDPEPDPVPTWLLRISSVVTRSRLIAFLSIVLLAVTGVFVSRAMRPKPYVLRPELQKLYNNAVEAMHQGAFFRASKLLQDVVKEDDRFALGHARLAEAYAELDYSEKAQQELLRAIAIASESSASDELFRLRWQGINHVVTADFPRAVESYKQLLAITPVEERKYALTDLGRAYGKNQQPDKAIESYQEVMKLDSNYAGAFVRLGVIYGRQAKYKEANEVLDSAQKLFERDNELEGLAEIALQRAVILTQQGKVADAKRELQDARQKSTALNHQEKHIRVLLNLSNNAINQGKTVDAKSYAVEAVTLAEQYDLVNPAIQGLIDVGNAYFWNGDFDQAETYFNQGVQLAQQYKARRSEARACLSIASLKTHRNDPVGAREYFQRALPFYQQGGYQKELAQAYAVFGHALDQAGAYNEALKIFEEQLDRANQIDDSQQSASSHEGLGVVLNHLQRYPEALSHFQEQYKLVKSLENTGTLGYAAMNIGTMSWQLGDYSSAETKFTEVFQISESRGERDKALAGWTSVSKAQMLLSRSNFPAAIVEAELASSLAGAQSKHIEIQARSTIGLAQVFSGAVLKGLQNCEQAVELARTIKDPLPLSRALLALAEAELKAKKFELALRYAQEAQQQLTKVQHYESEWRALLVQALAKNNLGDKVSAAELAQQALVVLRTIEQQWGASFVSYMTRLDIKSRRAQLDELLTTD